jgi:hypothetical protein
MHHLHVQLETKPGKTNTLGEENQERRGPFTHKAPLETGNMSRSALCIGSQFTVNHLQNFTYGRTGLNASAVENRFQAARPVQTLSIWMQFILHIL